MSNVSPQSTTEKIMRRIAFLIACGCLTAGFVCQAQAQNAPQPRPSPEEMQKSMDAAMGAMVPMMGRMTEVMIEAQLKLAERPETAERIAIFKRNLFEALQKKGFSPEQALQITLSTALPAAAPSK
jgi:hypothetical protein